MSLTDICEFKLQENSDGLFHLYCSCIVPLQWEDNDVLLLVPDIKDADYDVIMQQGKIPEAVRASALFQCHPRDTNSSKLLEFVPHPLLLKTCGVVFTWHNRRHVRCQGVEVKLHLPRHKHPGMAIDDIGVGVRHVQSDTSSDGTQVTHTFKINTQQISGKVYAFYTGQLYRTMDTAIGCGEDDTLQFTVPAFYYDTITAAVQNDDGEFNPIACFRPSTFVCKGKHGHGVSIVHSTVEKTDSVHIRMYALQIAYSEMKPCQKVKVFGYYSEKALGIRPMFLERDGHVAFRVGSRPRGQFSSSVRFGDLKDNKVYVRVPITHRQANQGHLILYAEAMWVTSNYVDLPIPRFCPLFRVDLKHVDVDGISIFNVHVAVDTIMPLYAHVDLPFPLKNVSLSVDGKAQDLSEPLPEGKYGVYLYIRTCHPVQAPGAFTLRASTDTKGEDVVAHFNSMVEPKLVAVSTKKRLRHNSLRHQCHELTRKALYSVKNKYLE